MELFEEVKLNILKFIWRTYFYSQKFAFALSFVFAVFCINFSNIFALIFSMKIRRRNKSNPTLLGLHFVYFSRILNLLKFLQCVNCNQNNLSHYLSH